MKDVKNCKKFICDPIRGTLTAAFCPIFRRTAHVKKYKKLIFLFDLQP